MAVSPLEGASRRLPKVTYVPLTVEVDRSATGGALPKRSYVARLNLQPGEVPAVLGTSGSDLAPMLRRFEGSPLPSSLPRATSFAVVPSADLLTFGRQLQTLREQRLAQVVAQDAGSAAIAAAQSLLNTVVVANGIFDASGAVSPVGMLNLERLEMTPAGMQRGELIATIPLAPGETTTVFQKEWSVTTQEFTSIVSDSLENYSETGVTENTELAQSTTSQVTHSNQFNVNATASGGCGFVSGSAAASFGGQDQNSQSATDSRKDAIATTKKASSRVKQEHKTSISNTTVTGSQEGSTRTITNPSTNAIRIDYFSLMRKWRVRLYRYGLRLTHDIVIPEPGAAMRKAHAELAQLQSQLGPFEFNVPHSDITEDIRTADGETEPHYLMLADRYGAQPPSFPEKYKTFTTSPTIQVCPSSGACGVVNSPINVPVDDGYAIDHIVLDGDVQGFSGSQLGYGILGTTFFQQGGQSDQLPFLQTKLVAKSGGDFLNGAEGSQTLGVYMNDVRVASIVLTVTVQRTDAAYSQWQSDVWNALYNAAQTQYYAQQQDISARIAALQEQISNVDTLTLRREENDEIMKTILRWLLGNTFDFMPSAVVNAVEDLAKSEEAPPTDSGLQPLQNPLHYGEAFADASLQLSSAALTTMYQYGEEVKFINEAIEWENLVYFLYSYFWDIPASWDFISGIRHPDATRQAFLRAGSARVVVPVRKGFEQAWINFVETGSPQITLGAGTPYMTIAQEIFDYDQTNYPGIPPANPAGDTSSEQSGPVATSCHQTLTGSTTPVTLTVDSTAGFLVGYKVVIDMYDTGKTQGGKFVTAQESQTITAMDPTHLTIPALLNPHDGSATEFPIVQPGEAGILIAEWNEYTPTSGTDIAVGTDLLTLP